MRRLPVLALAFLFALPILADDGDQSYISYDSGDTVVIQGIDNREVEVDVNSPVFAGDQVVTARHGRVEIRLADENIVALDRRTTLLFHGMRGGYETDDEQTIVELIRGKMILHQTTDDSVPVRIDTRSASYQSLEESVLAVETDGYRDQIAVFGGLVEVRTRQGAYRLRAGERVYLDENGIYESQGLARQGMDDFERWYLRRSDDTRGYRSRYLDGRISHAEPVLDAYGSWVYVQDYGSWVWRPRVSVGWKPYYHGRWTRGRSGALVWVSYEPWGWVPYHYGRWAYSHSYGWIWLPGSVYSPAWVYWAYGPSWVGWVPWGYYDCYTPYLGWLYRPRMTIRVGVGFGFWGRVHVSDRDLNHWVVVGPDHLVSTRVDRAALTTDRIRERLQRDGDRATFTDTPARFTRDELKNPGEAVRTIARRVPGEGTGTERSGSDVVDATRFFRRDPDLSNTLRERLVRDRSGEGTPTREAAGRTLSGSDRGDREGRSVVPRERAGEPSDTVRRPAVGERAEPKSDRPTRVISRDSVPPRSPVIDRGTSTDRPEPDRTERVTPDRTRPSRDDGASSSRPDVSRTIRRPSGGDGTNESSSWRERGIDRRPQEPTGSSSREPSPDEGRNSKDRNWREAPVPGRVIDSIGGARLVPSGSSDEGSSRTRTTRPDRSSPDRSSRSVSRDSRGNDSSVSRERSPSVSRESSSPTRERPAVRSRPSQPPSSSTSSDSSRSSSTSSTRPSDDSSKSSSRGRVSRSKPDRD